MRLKQLREERRLTLEQVAKSIGTSKVTLSRYERAERSPGIRLVSELAEFFGVDIEWLIGQSDHRHNNNSDIVSLYKSLDYDRQLKVYNFAQQQLDEQNKDTHTKKAHH